MKKLWVFIIILISFIFISTKTIASEQPQQYIVRFKTNTPKITRNKIFTKFKATWQKDLPLINSSVVKMSQTQMNFFKKDPNILVVEPDIIFTSLENEEPNLNINKVSALGICDWFPQFPGCIKPTPKPSPSINPSPTLNPSPSIVPTPKPTSSPSPAGSPIVSPTPIVSPSVIPSSNQTIPWGVAKISAPEAWNYAKGENVKVAIIDTGVDTNHPDLKDNISGCINFIVSTKTCEDDNGHGTHVAGIIASKDNDIGVVGVAPSSKIYALKSLNRNGSGYMSDIIEALDWSINNHMQVINMSLGSTQNSTLLSDAVTRVYNSGIIIVAAAGNSGPNNNTVNYPAKYSQVIAVGALDKNDSVPSWSSRGQEMTIAGPGVDIYSTYFNDVYKTLSGTSMATPYVVGAVALKLQIVPNVTPLDMKNLVKNTADILSSSTNLVGAGRINAYKLMTY